MEDEVVMVTKLLGQIGRLEFFLYELEDKSKSELAQMKQELFKELVEGAVERLNEQEEIVRALVADLRQWLVRVAVEDWSREDLEERLRSGGGLKEEYVMAFVRYWKKEHARIRQAIVDQSNLVTPRYNGMRWRIDAFEETNKDSVLIEMDCKRTNGIPKRVCFKLDLDTELSSFQHELDDIANALNSYKTLQSN